MGSGTMNQEDQMLPDAESRYHGIFGSIDGKELAVNLFENGKLRWKRFTGGDKFDYPIDYSAALLNAREDGHVDLLYRWDGSGMGMFYEGLADLVGTANGLFPVL